MTTPVKPERMTDAAYASSFTVQCMAPDYGEAACTENATALDAEARRARSEESSLSRQVEGLWDLAEALAHELGRHIEARLETERECATLERERDEALAAYAQAKLDTSDTARELAAAREEADRLRASKKRIAEGLTKLRAKVERGLNLAEYLRALNELEPDHADE